ncbi:MAG: hypothetical protein VZQ47_03860 [Treponema sp.]|nr:hypothetical protein [Treponema sp.]MEE3434676.1 hypothetical protein [Treponema sp.]
MHSKFLKISAAVFFAAALFSCSFDAPESDKGSISMRLPDKSQLGAACANGVSHSVSSDGSLSAGSVDQFKVVVRNISSRESITQFVAPGSSVTVDELEPGSWDVAIFGYANDPQGSGQSIRYYGNARGIPVEGGETSNATVGLYDISGNMPGFGFNGVDPSAAPNIQYAYMTWSCAELGQGGEEFYACSFSAGGDPNHPELKPPVPVFMEPGYNYKAQVTFYVTGGLAEYTGSIDGLVPANGGLVEGNVAQLDKHLTPGNTNDAYVIGNSFAAYAAGQFTNFSLDGATVPCADASYKAVNSEACGGAVPYIASYGKYSCVLTPLVHHPSPVPTVSVPNQTVQKGQTITVSAALNPPAPKVWPMLKIDTAVNGFSRYIVDSDNSDSDTWTDSLTCNEPNANKVEFNDNTKTLTGKAAGSNNFTWTVTVTPGPFGETPATTTATANFTATCVEAAQPSGGGGTGGNAAVNENFVNSQKKFSVAAGKQVYFSQGNLQYQASTDTWRFAEHQYDVVPEDKLEFANINSTYEEWIDLFGWGSSGYARAKPYTRDYSVTDESGKSILTSLNVYGAIGVYADLDWGIYNPIANGGNKKGLWYTLTDAEWTYLLNTRTNASSLRAPATITDTTTSPAKSVAGLVVLPDDWTAPSDISFTIPVTTTGDAGWAVNVFTLEEWEKMECSGAVFLPALGMQDSSGSFSNRSSNFRVYYWSSSCYSSNADTKYCIEYDGPTGSPYRYSPSADNFMPVRLVKSAVDISPNIYISPNASSGGDGSAASPYASIADAIAQIKTNSSRTTDYTIYIDGALTGKQEIKDITPDCVKSITIKGKNGINPATGEPRDSLTGDGAASSGPLLTIATNAVVKVEDLKITGGYAEQGGGVYVGNGSIACYVTLGSGALITGNKADTKGAGVYATDGDGTYLTIDGAVIKNNELVSDTAGSRLGSAVYSIGKQLVIKGDSLITNNLGSNEDNACPAVCVDWYQYRTSGYDISKFPESSIEGNAQIVNNTGVGVKAYVCNLSIKGNAKISGNTNAMSNSQGGGMIVEGYTRYYNSTYTAKVTISENAQISGNFADNGAGVFVKNSDTTLKIEGGSINGNKAQKLGGGVYCYGATIEISGGSIESNKVLADSTTTEGGGGVYLESWNNTSANTSNNAAIYLSGGTIKSNTCAGGLGTGIFANDFSTTNYNEYMVKIQDAGKVDLSNDIYLMRTTYLNPVIRIMNDLTETGTLAKVSLEKYENGNEVLGKGYYDPWTYINNHYSQFEIANSAWTLNSSGKLVSN